MENNEKVISNSNSMKKTLNRKTKRLIFYILLFAIPIIQFSIMGVYIKFASLSMAFEKYKASANGYVVSYTFLDNFKGAIEYVLANSQLVTNSLLVFVCCAIPGLTLSVIVSYYIYKKYFLSKTFMFILFLPKVIAPIVFSVVFKYMATDLYMELSKSLGEPVQSGLLSDVALRLPILITYSMFMSICANILLYVGGMTSINESVVEYAQLDGVGFWQEFWYVVLPSIYPTVVTFFTVSISSIFTVQMHLFDFFAYGAAPAIRTLGYEFYVSLLESNVVGRAGYMSYPELTALGMLIMIILIPLTLTTKKLLLKYGPRDD